MSCVPQAMGKVDTETENPGQVDRQAIETAEAPAVPPSSKEFFCRASIDSQWIGRGGVGCGFAFRLGRARQQTMVLWNMHVGSKQDGAGCLVIWG